MQKYEQDFIYKILPELTKAVNDLTTAVKGMNGQAVTTTTVSSTGSSGNAIARLKAELMAFGQQAIVLSDAISEANAEEIIATGYPFDKSFDEKVIDIINWTSDVITEVSGRQEAE